MNYTVVLFHPSINVVHLFEACNAVGIKKIIKSITIKSSVSLSQPTASLGPEKGKNNQYDLICAFILIKKYIAYCGCTCLFLRV